MGFPAHLGLARSQDAHLLSKRASEPLFLVWILGYATLSFREAGKPLLPAGGCKFADEDRAPSGTAHLPLMTVRGYLIQHCCRRNA
jgi:hypothetical protein